MPTPVPSSTPRVTQRGATAAGRGVRAATAPASPIPTATPKAAPTVLRVADSMSTWVRMSRRRAPRALRTPISRVRSITETSMMFMMTTPPTTREIPTNPGSAVKRMRLMLSQKLRESSAVSAAKFVGSEGRRRRRTRMSPSTSVWTGRTRAGSSTWMMMSSTTPRGDRTRPRGDFTGATRRLSWDWPKRDPSSSSTPTTRYGKP